MQSLTQVASKAKSVMHLVCAFTLPVRRSLLTGLRQLVTPLPETVAHQNIKKSCRFSAVFGLQDRVVRADCDGNFKEGARLKSCKFTYH